MSSSTEIPRRRFELSLHSDQKKIHEVEEFLYAVDRTIHIGDEKLSTLLLVVTEAVNNGIVHGNKREPSKKVYVTCEQLEDLLVIRVKDEGNGFDPAKVKDPLQPENLLRESGRGVFLMKQMMNSVEYNATGNEVVMTLKV